MNLYYFNPNTYGTEWFVMAETREEAIEAVKAHVRKDRMADLERTMAQSPWPKDWPPREGCFSRGLESVERAVAEVDAYVNETGASWRKWPPCIQVFGRGEVVQTEIC